MIFRKLKPETIIRLRKQAIEEKRVRMLDTLARTKELIKRDGPDSIWAEMYEEHFARCREAGYV